MTSSAQKSTVANAPQRRHLEWLWVAGVTAALMLGSALFKSACVDAAHNYSWTCYSDVLELFTSRNVAAHVFPYVHGRLVNGAPVDTYEYPVLTGVFIWFCGLFASSRGQFLIVTAVLLSPCALYVSVLLRRMAGTRALLWAASPALILYGVHNWDLLAVAASVAALHAWWRGRPLLAATLLAVGGCLKIYPLLFLLPLVADLLHRRLLRRAGEAAGLAAGLVLLINLPFLVANPAGWWTTYVFQQRREADSSSNSVWFWGHDAVRLETQQLNRLLLFLVGLSLVTALVVGWRRTGRGEAYPVLQVCGASLISFMLLNKVASPQYTLWILPFFALLRLRVGWWAAYLVSDALVYVGVFRWFTDLSHGQDFGLAKQALVVGVWTKAALQLVLYVLMLRSSSAVTAEPTPVPEVTATTGTTTIAGTAVAVSPPTPLT